MNKDRFELALEQVFRWALVVLTLSISVGLVLVHFAGYRHPAGSEIWYILFALVSAWFFRNWTVCMVVEAPRMSLWGFALFIFLTVLLATYGFHIAVDDDFPLWPMRDLFVAVMFWNLALFLSANSEKNWLVRDKMAYFRHPGIWAMWMFALVGVWFVHAWIVYLSLVGGWIMDLAINRGRDLSTYTYRPEK